jgi:antitoxin HigA-1
MINIESVLCGADTMPTKSRSLTTTEVKAKMGHAGITRKGTPKWRVHPGEILREEFLKPLGISAYELAKRLRVPVPRVNDIVLERRGISADTAVRLSRFFGTTDQFWLNLQSAYEISRIKAERGAEIALIEPRAASAVG